MFFNKLFLILTASLIAFSQTVNATNEINPSKNNNLYLLKHVSCKYRKKDKVSYCVDKDNKNITGEIRKYADGKITLSIPVKDGLIDGTVRAFKRNGEKKYEKNYQKGQVHGLYDTFYEGNKIKTSTTYKNNIKEGIAKHYYPNGYIEKQLTYVANKMDGKMRTYDQQGKTTFDFITANDKIVKGVYHFIDKKDKILTAPLPQIIINALNEECVILRNKLTDKCYLIDIDNTTEGNCNQEWLKENLQTLELTVNKCKSKE